MEDFLKLIDLIISLLDSGKIGEACIVIDDAYCLYPEKLLFDSYYARLINDRLHAAERAIGFNWNSYRKEAKLEKMNRIEEIVH